MTSIYKLNNAGKSSTWTKLTQTLSVGRQLMAAFPFPDQLVTCF